MKKVLKTLLHKYKNAPSKFISPRCVCVCIALDWSEESGLSEFQKPVFYEVSQQ